jgi:FkbM family methyltransferase
LKSLIQRILQFLLGYDLYLWSFTRFKLKVLKYDKNENDFFHFISLVKPEATVLDIGANIGLMTFYMAKRFNHVVAFEPMPNNIKVIEKLISKYHLSNVNLQKCALGNENTQIQLVLPVVDGVKKQGLSHVVDEKMTEFNEGGVIETQCYKLDDVEDLKSLKIDAIKIDVENFEYEVFQGAKALLSKDKPMIYCELWNNQNRIDCFNFLESLGYQKFVYVNNKLELLEGNPSDIQNFFFIAKQD